MTTGHVLKDNTALVPGPIYTGGSPRFGPYFKKDWSGADRPAVPGVKYPPVPPFAYNAFRKDGSRVLRYHKSAPLKPAGRTRKAADGEHAYSVIVDNLFTPMMEVYQKSNGAFLGNQSNTWFGSGTWATRWSSNDDLKLIQKLRERMNGSQFDAGVFLGTGLQTVELIGGTATRIYKAYKAVRRGNLKKAASALGIIRPRFPPRLPVKSKSERIAQDWLGLQYGWLPLLSDVKQLAESLSHHVNAPFRQTYVVRRKIDDGKVSLIGGVNPGVIRKSYTKESGQIIARFTELPSIWKLEGLTDPTSLAWEVTPWSFVVDWFIPIGDWLEARSFASGLTGTFITTKRMEVGIFDIDPAPTDVSRIYKIKGSYFRKYVKVDRSVSSSLSVPIPSFVPLGDVPGWRRAANAVGLLVTNGRRFGG